MNAPQPVVKQGRKWTQVLDGARTIFMRDGFEGASVDDIVREAGVSKATLYSYFPDKRLLFLEVAKIECQAQSEAAVSSIETSGDIREGLTVAARRMVRFFTSDVGMQVYRIVVGESQRFPEIGREFYAAGPAVVREILKKFLQKGIDEGRLQIDDLDLATDQFPELCKAGIHLQLAIGLRESVSEDEIDRAANLLVAAWEMQNQIGIISDPKGFAVSHDFQILDGCRTFVKFRQQRSGKGLNSDLNFLHAGLRHQIQFRPGSGGPDFREHPQVLFQSNQFLKNFF